MLRTLHQNLRDGVWLAKVLAGAEGFVKAGEKRNVLVEFSSPNIAKPFHVGHIRSTILGNFISSIIAASGSPVTKINYLGDWGTQFGILSNGFSQFGDYKDLEKSPAEALRHLHSVYVRSNQEAADNPEFRKEALKLFADMESGERDALSFWEMVSELSEAEFRRLYQRLNVDFTVWERESESWKEAGVLLRKAEEENRLSSSEGAKGVWDDRGRFIILEKGDGSTLYLTRDVASVQRRNRTYSPAAIIYVVDASQRDHFLGLKTALNAFGHSEIAEKVIHIPFGLIKGMSSRKGGAILLDDIIEEGIERVRKTILIPGITRLESAELESAAENLATSALITYDLKRKRVPSYSFRWDLALAMKGESGVYLQKAHAKLCSLVGKGRAVHGSGEDFNYDCLSEPEAIALMEWFAKATPIFRKSFAELEPCHIAQYLFKLGRLVSTARKRLEVAEAPTELALPRLHLFDTARKLLGVGLQLLGMRPMKAF